MAEGTRHAQLVEAVSMLKGESVHLREEQDKQKHMLEVVLQQLNNLAASYGNSWQFKQIINKRERHLPIQEVESEKEEKELGELLGISLHAMGGSTHSFVDPYVARRSKLPVGKSHMIVKVANGDSLPCQGGCGVVLGVDWLRSLGFHYMEFH
ncbi:hypothetical protein Pint_15239 [Pistacia integerrima]|uniref:Uncharacterized protein n=1 Tax=Pistacia integerrima TaxID=434235 RepID=A0ACC0ZDY4_9ROSI|nr:hypothetical protein Pint_15239 [Pistacia integerrima]